MTPILQFPIEEQRLRALRIFIRRLSKLPIERRDQISRDFGLAGYQPAVNYLNALSSQLSIARREARLKTKKGELILASLKRELRHVR